jgi:S1-C subfamily serine protease
MDTVFFMGEEAMTRAFWWMGAALAAALWAAPADRALAQASVDAAAGAATEAADDVSASGSTSVATDAASGSASGSIDASGSADTSASTSGSAQADTSAAGTQADTQASGSATTDQSSTSATGSVQGSTGTTPSPSTETSAQTGVNANANLDASAQANQAAAPSTQPGAAAAGSTNVDANLQGQAGLQAQQGTNVQAGLSTQAQTIAQQQLRTGLQFGQPTAQGLAINTLEPSNLFFNSGVRPGDVLVSYAGRPVRTQADFWRYAVWQPGQRIPVIVMRDGRQQTIYVTYQQQHQASYAPQSQAYLGVTFDANAMHAAVVRTVTPGSPAEQAGLRAGDQIVALNGNRVQGANDVIRTVQTLQPGASLDIAFTRPVENRTQVTLGQRPGVAQASYGPDVRVQTYGAAPSVPAPPTPPSTTVQPVPATVQSGAQIESSADPTPRVDRPADFDDDGRVLDRDQRVNRVGRDRGRPGGIR